MTAAFFTLSRRCRACWLFALCGLLWTAAPDLSKAENAPDAVDKALAASSYLDPAPQLTTPGDLLSWQHPENTLLLVYSAGSEEERLPDPCGPDRRTTPPFLADLAGETLTSGGPTIALLVYCTPLLLGDFDQSTSQGEPKIARRSQALVALLDRLQQRGLSSQQIFLVGQSAGAWASLEAAGARPEKLAGVIALAPAFAGPRDDRPDAWQTLFETRRAALTTRLAKSLDLKSLIFSFSQDRYGEAEDLQDLALLANVDLQDLPSHRIEGRACRGYHPHRTAFYDCFRRSQLTRIKDFLVQTGQ